MQNRTPFVESKLCGSKLCFYVLQFSQQFCKVIWKQFTEYEAFKALKLENKFL